MAIGAAPATPTDAVLTYDTPAAAGPDYRRPLAVVTSLFFMWGGITALNDIIIPHLKSIFELSYAQVMLVQSAFFSGYFIFALPAGRLIEAIGYKRAMVAGLCVMALGTVLFIPAAAVPAYWMFLAALFILAAGMTVLQVSANPYVTVLGPPRTASSRLNLAQGFNSLGTTVFPYAGGVLILGAVATGAARKAMTAAEAHAYQVSQAGSVRVPYLVLTAALLVLAVLIGLSKLPVIAALQKPATDEGNGGRSVWSHRQLVLGAIGIFTYVGAEVAIGSFVINYLSDPLDKGGLNVMTAATAGSYFLPLYWFGAMIGRFVGSALLQKVNAGKLLAAFAACAIVLVATTMLTTGYVAAVAVLSIGLFNSIMFPNIFALGIEGLGDLTSKGSSILVAAIVGGAIIPVIQGKIADHVGVHHAFILPLVCYAYIAYFAVDRWRHRANEPATAPAA